MGHDVFTVADTFLSVDNTINHVQYILNMLNVEDRKKWRQMLCYGFVLTMKEPSKLPSAP